MHQRQIDRAMDELDEETKPRPKPSNRRVNPNSEFNRSPAKK
jgi:hypothetical protein